MLVQLVRPLVRSQIQMLAQTPSANAKLMGMIVQWLGYLGVKAEVTQLKTEGKLVQVSLKVARPEQCTEAEWQQILDNLTHESSLNAEDENLTYEGMTDAQRSKVHRLLACVLRASNDNLLDDWEQMKPQLMDIGINNAMLQEMRAAVRIPTPMSLLVQKVEPEVASFALSKAIAIALLDKHINQAEDDALKALLDALQQEATA